MSSKPDESTQVSRIQPVIGFLEKNYHRPLSLKEVAGQANLSPYYFHRIFKKLMGETLNQYLRRLKLEHAANKLFFKKSPVTQVALDVGFSSAQALSKALNSHFGLSAKQIKLCDDIPTFRRLIENSKIGHQLSNFGHANTSSIRDNRSVNEKKTFIMKTQNLEEQKLVSLRVNGAYNDENGVIEQAVQSLYQLAELNNVKRQDVQILFLYQDNPQITPASSCRTDVCMSLANMKIADLQELNAPFQVQTLRAGHYAYHRASIHEGSDYIKAWDELLNKVVHSNWTVDNAPMVQKFHCFDQATQVSDVSFLVPIKSKTA